MCGIYIRSFESSFDMITAHVARPIDVHPCFWNWTSVCVFAGHAYAECTCWMKMNGVDLGEGMMGAWKA